MLFCWGIVPFLNISRVNSKYYFILVKLFWCLFLKWSNAWVWVVRGKKCQIVKFLIKGYISLLSFLVVEGYSWRLNVVKREVESWTSIYYYSYAIHACICASLDSSKSLLPPFPNYLPYKYFLDRCGRLSQSIISYIGRMLIRILGGNRFGEYCVKHALWWDSLDPPLIHVCGEALRGILYNIIF